MKTKEQMVNLGLTEKQADEVMLLEERMLEQAVAFQFRKKDNTIRNAIGTLCRSLMKQADGTLWEPKGEAKPYAPIWFRYFDLGAKDWRQFSIFNLIAVEG